MPIQLTSIVTVTPVNINYFVSQQSTQGNQRTKGCGPAETLPRIQRVAAGVHKTNIFKSACSETAKKSGEGGGSTKLSHFSRRG